MKEPDFFLRSRKCILLSVLFVFLLTGGALTEQQSGPDQMPTVGQRAGSKVSSETDSLNTFSLQLYQEVAKEQKGNLAVSPLGSYILLALLQEGAGPSTQAEIAKVLKSPPEVLPRLKSLLSSLGSLPSLSLAQKIYLDDGVELLPSYNRRTAPFVVGPAEKVPFSKNVAGAKKTINDWVEAQTQGLIKDFIQKLYPNTIAVLVSVLHFKGQWKTEFDPKETAPGTFTLADGKTIQTPMMKRKRAQLAAKQVDGGWAVVLPYRDSTEMVLLLPSQGVQPDSMVESKVLAQVPVGLPPYRDPVNLELPKFEFEVPTFELTNVWKTMGLTNTVDQPDLSKMLSDSQGLKLEVLHKTYIKVNEEGTEAAAATAVAVTRSHVGPTPVDLVFDRPFLFILRHSETGAIFMLGRVEKP